VTNPPAFAPSDSPPAIVAAAGDWLANELGGGFAYLRSKRQIVHRRAGRAESIELQTSPRSRAGETTTVMPRLIMTDSYVRAWQKGKSLTGLFADGGYIFNSLLVNLGIQNVELFGPLRAQHPDLYLSLDEFLAAVQREVMPCVQLMREGPSFAADKLPIRWIVFPEPPFWWAAAYGDHRAAKRFLARYFEANPGSRAHFERGRVLSSSDAGPPFGNTLVALGWSAVRSGALTADEPI